MSSSTSLIAPSTPIVPKSSSHNELVKYVERGAPDAHVVCETAVSVLVNHKAILLINREVIRNKSVNLHSKRERKRLAKALFRLYGQFDVLHQQFVDTIQDLYETEDEIKSHIGLIKIALNKSHRNNAVKLKQSRAKVAEREEKERAKVEELEEKQKNNKFDFDEIIYTPVRNQSRPAISQVSDDDDDEDENEEVAPNVDNDEEKAEQLRSRMALEQKKRLESNEKARKRRREKKEQEAKARKIQRQEEKAKSDDDEESDE